MTDQDTPLVIEPDALEARLGENGLLIVDLCKPETYRWGHVPGAVYLPYGEIVAERRPVGGLLPDAAQLSRVLSAIGLTEAHWVVAYDDEGGGRAGRLLWTLDVLGHPRASLLNGGLHAWANEGHPLDSQPVDPVPTDYRAVVGEAAQADAEYIRSRLGRADLALLDTRSAEEFSGAKRFAARGGHIPGAVNMDWVQAMDQGRNLRLKPAEALRERLAALGVTGDKDVVVYCQTHHRSSHTYVMLRSLGFERVRGYAGAWSDWGNRPELPVE